MTSTIRIHGIVNGLILIVLLALLGSTPGYAQNEGCTLNGDDADCTDVPVDGIVFVTIEPGAGATEINVSDGVAGTTTVSPTRPGISLFVYGSDGSDAGADVEFQTMAYDHDNDTDTANISVVTKDGTSPYLVNGQYIRNLGGNPPTFSLGGTSYSAVGLAQYLTAVSSDGGGTVSGALTINNPPGLDTPASGTGASFTTTNAPGIVAETRGGGGGGGGCGTVLVYSWCDDGDNGGDAGSVVVNNNGSINASGGGIDNHGISARSQGGAGGNGGGWFGLFASDAGAGGDGGDGDSVWVSLGPDSNITTSGIRKLERARRTG